MLRLYWWRWVSPQVTQFKICAIWSFYFAYEVDTLVEVSLGILNTDVRRQLGWIHVGKYYRKKTILHPSFMDD